MKRPYQSPELKGMHLSFEDIIMVSEEQPVAVALKTTVNGKEGIDLGAGDVSLMDQTIKLKRRLLFK